MLEYYIIQADVTGIAQSVNAVWILVASFMVFLMQPGFALLEAGQVRAKNVANVAMKNMMDWSHGVLVYFGFGLGLAGLTGAVTSPGPVSVASAFAYINSPESWITWLFGAVFAMTAATIVSGAVAERITFKAYVMFAVVLTAVIYPVVQGLVWQGGLLSEAGYLGQLLGTGYLDFAGGTVVHMVGGIAGLVAAALIGPREERFDAEGNSQPIPGHSVFLALLGTLILAFGWYGFNVGTQATVLTTGGTFNGAALGRVALNTTLGMGAGTVASASVATVWRGDPDPLFTANGLLGGLVAVTSGTAYLTWWGAILVGAVGGGLVLPTYQWVLDELQIDDVCGVFAVHGAAGGVGALLIPVFSVGSNGQWALMGASQFLMQAVGVAVIGTWTVLSTIAAFRGIGFVTDLRVSTDDERDGLDAAEHNISAYPEFNVVREDGEDPDQPESEGGGSAPAAGGVTAQSEVMWRGQEVDDEGDRPVTVARESLVSGLSKPAVVIDPEGTVAHANEPAESFFDPLPDGGVARSAGTADPGGTLTLDAFDPDAREAIETALETGEPLDGHRTTVTRDGEERTVRLTAAPIGPGAGVLTLIEDITDRLTRRRENEALIDYRDDVLGRHRARLERLAEGDLDIDSGIVEPERDIEQVQAAHAELAAVDEALATVVGNVHAIVEKLPDQSAELAARSESLNDLSDEVRTITGETDDLTTDIAGEIETLADDAADVAAIIEDQTAAIEQISSSTTEISRQSAAATTMTEQAVTDVDDVVSQIRDATEVSEAVTADIESLDDRMAAVEEIVTIINEIATQTNILALNASIEAAQADQDGEGFAVVAQEVKNLAEETRSQADDIATIITELKAETESVVENIQRANDQVTTSADELTTVVDTLEDAQERVAETNNGIEEISEAADRQADDATAISNKIDDVSSHADRINTNIDEIAANIDDQTDAVGTVSTTADELEALAADMDESVDAFSAEARQEISAGD